MLRKMKLSNPSATSVRITIPKYITMELGLKAEQEVDVYMKGKKIIIDTDITKVKDK